MMSKKIFAVLLVISITINVWLLTTRKAPSDEVLDENYQTLLLANHRVSLRNAALEARLALSDTKHKMLSIELAALEKRASRPSVVVNPSETTEPLVSESDCLEEIAIRDEVASRLKRGYTLCMGDLASTREVLEFVDAQREVNLRDVAKLTDSLKRTKRHNIIKIGTALLAGYVVGRALCRK